MKKLINAMMNLRHSLEEAGMHPSDLDQVSVSIPTDGYEKLKRAIIRDNDGYLFDGFGTEPLFQVAGITIKRKLGAESNDPVPSSSFNPIIEPGKRTRLR